MYIIVSIALFRFYKEVITKLFSSPLAVALVNLLVFSFLNCFSYYISIRFLYIVKLVLIDRWSNIILRFRQILQYISVWRIWLLAYTRSMIILLAAFMSTLGQVIVSSSRVRLKPCAVIISIATSNCFFWFRANFGVYTLLYYFL